jgi:hypothetical protein
MAPNESLTLLFRRSNRAVHTHRMPFVSAMLDIAASRTYGNSYYEIDNHMNMDIIIQSAAHDKPIYCKFELFGIN